MALCMCRRQSVSGLVPEFAGKRRGLGLGANACRSDPRPWPSAGVLQLGLNSIPQLNGDDGLVLPVPDMRLVPDLANVDGIAEQRVDLAAGERIAALGPPRLEVMPLRPQSQFRRLAHDRIQAAKLDVKLEDRQGGPLTRRVLPD